MLLSSHITEASDDTSARLAHSDVMSILFMRWDSDFLNAIHIKSMQRCEVPFTFIFQINCAEETLSVSCDGDSTDSCHKIV
jgi:hypothetical protein